MDYLHLKSMYVSYLFHVHIYLSEKFRVMIDYIFQLQLKKKNQIKAKISYINSKNFKIDEEDI